MGCSFGGGSHRIQATSTRYGTNNPHNIDTGRAEEGFIIRPAPTGLALRRQSEYAPILGELERRADGLADPSFQSSAMNDRDLMSFPASELVLQEATHRMEREVKNRSRKLNAGIVLDTQGSQALFSYTNLTINSPPTSPRKVDKKSGALADVDLNSATSDSEEEQPRPSAPEVIHRELSS